jgi:hypothetical protein
MAGAEQLRTKAATIDAATQLVADRVSAYGRCALDNRSWRDGSCFFHAIAWWIDKIFGEAEALALLKASQVNGAAVRKFLCDWAELNIDLVLDDEGVETVAKLAVRAALDWPDPVDDFAAVPPEARLADQFAVVLDRMRRGEWADDFWATGPCACCSRHQDPHHIFGWREIRPSASATAGVGAYLRALAEA